MSDSINIGDQVKLIVSPYVSGRVNDIKDNVLILDCFKPEGTVWVDKKHVFKIKEQRDIRAT